MAYFPFFVDLEGQRGLIVGGGTVALRKAEKLLPYGPALTVVAPEPVSELAALPVELTRREFQPEDLDRADFVIAATDNEEENHRISALCQGRKIPVNVVDDKEACSFLFPPWCGEGTCPWASPPGAAAPLPPSG
ncbi:MAG: bifunctional precorrin-2 dehydrogenase/sirohydrochlorin ferrochelatase [Lawsonibacter sp.]